MAQSPQCFWDSPAASGQQEEAQKEEVSDARTEPFRVHFWDTGSGFLYQPYCGSDPNSLGTPPVHISPLIRFVQGRYSPFWVSVAPVFSEDCECKFSLNQGGPPGASSRAETVEGSSFSFEPKCNAPTVNLSAAQGGLPPPVVPHFLFTMFVTAARQEREGANK